mmetsp:Transcript_34491/g.98983  ORF Transcript_34491/g.98983 Transcript_34491/m.98983 type:complete len:373 (+) Transcript_34491:87-1205(+)
MARALRPLAATALLLHGLARACTYFEVEAPGGVWVAGRTMELGGGGGGLLQAAASSSWRVALHPRGEELLGERGRLGYVGVEAETQSVNLVSDGMNEAGLSVSLHTMRMAKYQEPDPTKASVLFLAIVPWLLSRADSVDAARRALANVSVTAGALGPDDFAHWAVADVEGKSVVVEYVNGVLEIHPNDVRVMTNDPDYQWHLKNLNMYVGLGPNAPNENQDLAVKTELGLVPQVWSQGFNLLGLPGDLSPASRFVRMFYLRQYAERHDPVASTDDAIVLATGLLNNVFIPRGTVAPMKPARSAADYDYTQYALVKIPAQRRLLFRSYRSMAWKEVDLSSLSWDEAKSMPLSDGGLGIEDVTGKFRTTGMNVV